jgi:hypothetical protein
MSEEETTTIFKCTLHGFHTLHKSDVTELAESEVTEPVEFHGVSDERLIPRSGASSNALNRVSSLTILGCRIFFF